MDLNLEGILAIIVVGLFIMLIYSKIKKQTMKETFEEIKELIGMGVPNE